MALSSSVATLRPSGTSPAGVGYLDAMLFRYTIPFMNWHGIGAWFVLLALKLPLELFVFFGSLIEEVVAPIPPQLIMVTAGSVAKIQGFHVVMLVVLGALGAVGKTLGAWIYYWLGDRLGHMLVPRYGKYIGVHERDIERVRIRLQGDWKDDVGLFVLRCIPLVPGTPLSIVCGMIRLNIRTFLGATFLGALLRNWVYLAIGFAGASVYRSLLRTLVRFERQAGVIGSIVLFCFLVGWFVYWLRHRKR